MIQSEPPAAPPPAAPPTPVSPPRGVPDGRFGGRPPQRPWRRRRLVVVTLAALLLLVAGVVAVRATATQRAAPPPAPPTPSAPPYQARGTVRPVAEARVGTTGGGVVADILVSEGDTVDRGQAIASVRGPSGTETLSAPWAGTIMAILVRRGDTVTPGTVVANLGDLTRLRVETTDVDEYLIAQVQQGQPVTVRVDALNGRILQGYVRSVTSQPQPGAQGTTTLQYPVVIDLVENPPDLRPGMTVRVSFPAPPPAQASPTATP